MCRFVIVVAAAATAARRCLRTCAKVSYAAFRPDADSRGGRDTAAAGAGHRPETGRDSSSRLQVTQSKGKTGSGVRHLRIGPEDAGQRIDNLLLRELRGVPRGRIYSMVRKGEVRVGGRRIRPNHRVEEGDELRLPPVHTTERPAAPAVPVALRERLASSVLHEDEGLLVVDKPSGLAVHGGSGVKVALVEALRVLRPDIAALELAHRIDRDTSGCVLLAKRRSVLRRLHTALRERTAEKRYLALVEGAWPRGLKHLEAPLERVLAASGERFVRVSAKGKPASTRVQVLRRLAGATLLEVRPETGRTHQIRVHLAHAGHPILGDEKYASPEQRAAAKARGADRLCLHAAAIAVPDWREGEIGKMRAFEAPMPADMAAIVERYAAA